MNKIFSAPAILAVAACAQNASSIPAVSMAGAYQGVTCQQAQTMLLSEQAQLAAMSSKQSGAVAGDAIGVLLIGIPVSSLSGGDLEGEIGATKGKILALEAKMMECK